MVSLIVSLGRSTDIVGSTKTVEMFACGDGEVGEIPKTGEKEDEIKRRMREDVRRCSIE